MSENIRGITFAEQAVTPADDAIVRRAVLGDGILTGCEITYSGSTLTMASGFIIACGRTFQITAAQNWAVVDATSGVARLLLTIDLTKTATENAFEQISFSVEYATAEDGFADLVQEDINISGTKYQIVAAVVSLGTGGITGIVSKLEKTEGGGGGLNFKVVPGLTQPGTATENTIWVKTEKLTGWYFSATQPENMAEGEVWFPTGTESSVEFNALKKNAVQVYPLSAKQYVSSTLVDVTAKTYRNGEWNDWIIFLFKSGEGAKTPFVKANASNASVTVDTAKITGVAHHPSDSEWYYLTEEKMSLFGKSEAVMVAKCTFLNGGTEWGPRLALLDKIPTLGYSLSQQGVTVYGSAFLSEDGETKEYIIPAADLNGEYIIGYHGIGSVEIYDIFVR